MAERIKRIREEIKGIIASLGSIYLGVSLISYSKWDPSPFTHTAYPAKNFGGVAGSYIADIAISFLGISAYSLPLILLIYGIRRIISKEGRLVYIIGTPLFVFSLSLMSHLTFSTFNFTLPFQAGGFIGQYFSQLLESYVSVLGAYIFALSSFLSSLILLSPVSLFSLSFNKRLPAQEIPQKTKTGVLEEDILIREPANIKTTEKEETESPVSSGPVEIMDRTVHASVTDIPTKPSRQEGYELPSFELLTSYDTSSLRTPKDELLSNSQLLEAKLKDFDVEGKITHVHPGPVVTMYEFEPAPGVKINRVVGLSDDLALAHKAQSMRVSPIPGKATIGIEVPNRQREIVSLREIVSSDPYQKSASKLTLALGKDIFGTPVVADLAKMPHLLVAGSTGAGKSVSINSMVMSILYKATPSEVKMLMIDPKLLELSMYEDIPHLISPVITNPKKAAEALRKMVFEMERRYRLLAEKAARNIESFNSQASDEEKLPFIVIFIDELADLMFASSNEVEDSITRLAQMARAAGIHIIIATQRPSVDVITGLIKANFPARISFQVFSKIDSRTILDSQGAEQLLGKGDMLMMLPGTRLMRVHGALITEGEIKAVTDFIRSQGEPDYTMLEQIPIEEPATEGTASDERDDMYYKAVEFGETAGEVSISSIQRRFKIGYNRAARIMEMMEDDGLVGPPKGAGKPRDFIRRHGL